MVVDAILSFFINFLAWNPALGTPINKEGNSEKEVRMMMTKNRYFLELPNTKMVKSGTIRLASGQLTKTTSAAVTGHVVGWSSQLFHVYSVIV